MIITVTPPPATEAEYELLHAEPTVVPPPERHTARGRDVRILLVITAATAVLSLGQFAPPRVVPADAPATSFSAARAMRHVAAFARAPRPAGSAQLAATRGYVVAQLRALGLEPEIQATTTAFRFPGADRFNGGAVRNIVVRIPGTSASTGAILLGAHYDGGATGPAAADCGACVATLLETLRALRAGPPLRNDVIAVFTDGEEAGDLGAHAFATQHAAMREVRVALNFEAMGSHGPASLYATSPHDARLIAEVARGAPHVVGSSFAAALHPLLPAMRAACDLQDYMNAGSAGLGFVFTHRSADYHTVRDDARRLDPRSVQHFGAYALPLARHLGSLDLATLDARDDATFFTPWRGTVVHYRSAWALPLAALAAGGLALLLAVGGRRRVTRVTRIALGSLAFATSVVLTTALVTLAWWALRAIDADLRAFLIGNRATGVYVAALLALAVTAMAAAHAWLRPRLDALHLFTGALVTLAALAVASAVVFPNGAWVFTWPLAAGLLPLAWMVLTPRGPGEASHWARTTGIAIALVVAVLVLLPLGFDTPLALLVRLEGLSGLPFMAGATVFVTLLAGLLLPMIACADDAVPARRWMVAGRSAALAVLLLVVATALVHFDVASPHPDQIRYEVDADQQTARWATSDDRLDAWTSRFIPAGTKRDSSVRHGVPNGPPTWTAPAPMLPFAAPTLDLHADTIADGLRIARFQLRSPRGAPTLEVRVESDSAIEAVRVAGQTLDLEGYAPASRGVLELSWSPLPTEGIEVVVVTHGAMPIRLSLTDWSDGLPLYPGSPSYARPAGTMPAPGGTWDGIAVRRSLVIPEPQDGLDLRVGMRPATTNARAW